MICWATYFCIMSLLSCYFISSNAKSLISSFSTEMTCSFATPALFHHSLHHLLLTVQLKVYQSPKNDHSGCNSTLPPLHCIIWSAPSLRLGPTSGGSRENF